MPRIMLVDDNPAEAALLEEAFKRAHIPITIDAVPRIDAAVQLLRDGSTPELILLDFYLAGMTAVEALWVLRATEVGRHLRVVVLSSVCSEQDWKSCAAQGASTYLMKADTFEGWVRLAMKICDMLAIPYDHTPGGSLILKDPQVLGIPEA